MSLLGTAYRALARPVLFRMDAEAAHRLGARFLSLLHRSATAARLAGPRTPALEVDALGLRFPSPLGVAAGFDKAGRLYNGLGALGFGFIEVGTVTARPQPGNPRPRLFRLPADGALINRLGFNNPGAAAVAEAISACPPRGIVLGVNIGKSKVTPLGEAAADYAESARLLAPLADYLVVNVSSPNTPGLRSLQEARALEPVLTAVQEELARLSRPPPLLVKIAPDLDDQAIDAVVDLAVARGLHGIVATNTTIARPPGLRTPPAVVAALGEGGLSGAPLRQRTLEVVARIHARAGDRLTIIAAGGVASADHVLAALRAGATLVQLYTAFIYGGPDLPRRILDDLAAQRQAAGCATLAELAARR
jgi:dihydroorotate dehydrogenase